MHSSRIRTDHSSGLHQMSLLGGLPPGDSAQPRLLTEWLTDASENITFLGYHLEIV